MVRISDSPRDALQGLTRFIPTQVKTEYIRALLEVGYAVVETGSLVSEKAIPRMRDTADILKNLIGFATESKIQVLVGNQKFAGNAAGFDIVDIISYPFSCSNVFLQKNLNTSFDKSLETIADIYKITSSSGKMFTVYMAMAFGNPYRESWNVHGLSGRIRILKDIGIKTVMLSDTIGYSTPDNIRAVFETILPEYPDLQFGFHLHSTPGNWFPRIEAAFNAGCRWFEGVTGEAGGCPMTGYDMIGNISSLNLMEFARSKGIHLQLNQEAVRKSVQLASEIFI